MSTGDRHDGFAERLRRIEAGRQQSGRPMRDKPPPDFSNLKHEPAIRQGGGGPGTGMVLVLLTVFVAFVGAAAAFVFRDRLPVDMVRLGIFDKVSALSEMGKGSVEAARDGLEAVQLSTGIVPMGQVGARSDRHADVEETEHDDGRILRSPEVATATLETLDVNTIVSGLVPVTADVFPAGVDQVAPLKSCWPRRVAPDEQLVSVRMDAGGPVGGLQSFSNKALAARLLRNVEALSKSPRHYDRDGRLSPQVRVVDVFLTDASAPQYVVLQSVYGNVLWNLQPAPGVEIAHVVMVGGGGSGVVSGGQAPSVEAIRGGDFVTRGMIENDHEEGAAERIREGILNGDFQRGHGNAVRLGVKLRKSKIQAKTAKAPPKLCFPSPWRMPQEHWTTWQKAQGGTNMLYVNRNRAFTNNHTLYAEWFREAFGQDAPETGVSVHQADHVLAGQPPTAPYPYVPLDTGRAVIFATDHVMTGTSEARAAEIEALHVGLMRAAIGGDPSLYDPPVRVAGQVGAEVAGEATSQADDSEGAVQ